MATKLPEQIQRQMAAAQELVDAQRAPAPEAATPEPKEPVAPVTAQEPARVDDENSQTYAQRWRSLMGIFNSTKQQLETVQAQNQQLQQLVSTMQTAPVTNMANRKFLTETDVNEYGEDMVGMARRAAQEELKDFAGAVGSLKADLDNLRAVVPVVQNLTRETQATAQERFFADLARAVPDFEQVNLSTEFRQWLLTPDPMTGILRQTYLVDAQRSGDVGRVATIFNAWKTLSGTQGQTNSRLSPQQELERQQAPSRNLSTAPVTTEGRIWDPREIQALYADKTRGKYAGKEAEFKALEQDIFKAQKDGRIVRKAA